MNRIAAERKILGITQEELSDMVGVSASTINRWECDEPISWAALVSMRNIFNVDIDWLLGLSDERHVIAQ